MLFQKPSRHNIGKQNTREKSINDTKSGRLNDRDIQDIDFWVRYCNVKEAEIKPKALLVIQYMLYGKKITISPRFSE
jgi:hypothetical protein